MNNVSPTFSIQDHLQYFVCRQVGPVCNVVDPGTWWSSSAFAAWDTACDDVLFYKLSVVFLIRCPKYCSFLFTSIPGRCLPPAFRSTSTLVCFASQGIRITRRYPVVSNASHRFHSSFLYVQSTLQLHM